jgi:hypothetical protein
MVIESNLEFIKIELLEDDDEVLLALVEQLEKSSFV